MNTDIIDNILSLNDQTPNSIMRSIARRVKERRLEKNLTQKALASRAGLSFGSYRRFETTGEISLRGIIMIALTLDMTDKFSDLFSTPVYNSMNELLNIEKNKQRKRGGKNE